MEKRLNTQARTASSFESANNNSPWQIVIQGKKNKENIQTLQKSSFKKASVQNQNISKATYKDPLRTWPIKGMAYTNELGAAISGIAPKLGTALWAPALMYIGADIYDKWKNEDTSYKPSGKRGVKEAVFQGCASVVLPTGAVGIGQRVISFLTRGTKTGLSAKAREDVLKHSLDFMNNHSLSSFENDIEAYKKSMVESIQNAAETMKDSYKTTNPVKKVLSLINPFKDPDNLGFANSEKLSEFAAKQAEKTMKMRESLMQNIKPKGMSKKLFNEFQKRKSEYKEIYSPDSYLRKAAKSILEEQHKNQIFKNKLIKTTGGFIALALLIKPIDKFVENIIIKKTVEPSIDFIQNKWQNYPYKGRIKNKKHS